MKRITLTVSIFCLLLMLCGCEKTMNGTDDLLAKAREVIPIAEAETAELAYAGLCAKDDLALVWFVSGSANQAHYYLPMECKVVGRNEYVYKHTYKPLERGTDIAVVQWGEGYCFLVNNPKCVIIRISDSKGMSDISIPKESYPYIYYMDEIPSEYYFLDANGNEVS